MFDVFTVIFGLVVVTIIYAHVDYRTKTPSKISSSLVQRIKDMDLTSKELEKKYQSLSNKVFQPIAEVLINNIKINRLSKMELADKLRLSGINKTPEEFMVKQATTGLALMSFSVVWIFILGTPLVLIAGVALGIVGAILPTQDLNKRIEARKDRIIMELPEFLDMLVLSLRTGRTLMSAVKKAAEHSGETLRPLLDRLQANMELEDVKKDALWDFAESTGIQEVRDFVSALEIGLDAKAKQAEEIYRGQAKIMRDLRVMALKRYTKTIPQKINLMHVWLYFNCVAIPLIGSVAQFTKLMEF